MLNIGLRNLPENELEHLSYWETNTWQKMELDKDFKEFVELLNAENVRYLIVGGYSVAHHGFPRYTGDFDI